MATTLPRGRTEVTLPDVALYPMLTEDESHVILSGILATEREPSTAQDIAASVVEPKSLDDILEIEGARCPRGLGCSDWPRRMSTASSAQSKGTGRGGRTAGAAEP